MVSNATFHNIVEPHIIGLIQMRVNGVKCHFPQYCRASYNWIDSDEG